MDRLIDSAPLVFVALVSAQEVKAPPTGREPVAQVLGGAGDTWRDVGRLGVHSGVVEVARRSVIEGEHAEYQALAAVDQSDVQLPAILGCALELRQSVNEPTAPVTTRAAREEPALDESAR